VKGTQRSDLESFDSVFGVIDRAGGAGEMKYVIELAAVERLVDVDLLKFKAWVAPQVIKVGEPSSQQIVDRDDRITLGQQCITQVGTEEAGSAGDQGARFAHEWLAFLGGALAASGGGSAVTAGRPTL